MGAIYLDKHPLCRRDSQEKYGSVLLKGHPCSHIAILAVGVVPMQSEWRSDLSCINPLSSFRPDYGGPVLGVI